MQRITCLSFVPSVYAKEADLSIISQFHKQN